MSVTSWEHFCECCNPKILMQTDAVPRLNFNVKVWMFVMSKFMSLHFTQLSLFFTIQVKRLCMNTWRQRLWLSSIRQLMNQRCSKQKVASEWKLWNVPKTSSSIPRVQICDPVLGWYKKSVTVTPEYL